MRHLPNIITLLRILLVLPIMFLLSRQQYDVVLWLFLIAAISDAVDGYLARRYHWQSSVGAMLDPLADKVMLVGCYLILGWMVLLPWWLVALVIFRDVVILTGALVYRWRCGELKMTPSLISKVNTILQMLLGLWVIVSAAGVDTWQWLLQALIMLVALSTLWSGIDYILVWSRRARACLER